MIVSCPACATRFSLDASLLGPNGRNVRCAKCSHRWRQEAPAAATGLPPLEGGDDVPADAGASEAAPGLMAPGLANLLGGRDAIGARDGRDSGGGDSAGGIPSGLGGLGLGGTGLGGGVVVPPKLRPAAPARKTGMWPMVLLAGILVGLLAAAYIFQAPISRMSPAAQDIYALLGLATEDPTQQLQIGNLKFEKRGEALLSVRGDIFNPTDFPVKVPPLLVVALDDSGKPMNSSLMFRTQESEMAPGETITFRKLYENPPPAQRWRVAFGRLDAKEP